MKGTEFAGSGYRNINPLAMIENVTVSMNRDSRFRPECTQKCDEMNPHELLLYAAAECTAYTLLAMLESLHIEPQRIEIGYSGDIGDEKKTPRGIFRSFHVVYNIACDTEADQTRISRAVRLTHEKYGPMTQMLRRIAPVSQEIALVTTQPEKA